MPTLCECYISECPLLSRRDRRGVPARREEGEEEEDEEGEEGEGGDAEEEEGEEGADAAVRGEAAEEEESGGDDDDDINHEYALDSDYDDDAKDWGNSDDD
ncbi:unnamed protein product [Closterium sp. NIES-54]